MKKIDIKANSKPNKNKKTDLSYTCFNMAPKRLQEFGADKERRNSRNKCFCIVCR